MSKKEVPVAHLEHYLPPGTTAPVLAYLHQYKVHLTVARQRDSILGDYRHSTRHEHHRISVNGNLNPYAFLITLLHELAHLLTFEQYGNKVAPHGREWKALFGQLLAQFIEHRIFPDDIQKELQRSLRNPAASSCAETSLLRVLRHYDPKKDGHCLVEDVPLHGIFRLKDGRVFKRDIQLRKRIKAVEVKTGKVYLFSPVYEVEILNS